jgi:hypothetical protein
MAKRKPEPRKDKRRRDEDEEAESLFRTNDEDDDRDIYDPDANDPRYSDLLDDAERDSGRGSSKSGKGEKRRRDDDDDDLDLDEAGLEPPRARAPVGVVGGAIGVVLTAVIALILFALLGFGIVIGGRIAGVIEPAIPLSGGSGFVRPTAVAVALDPVASADPAATVDPRCDQVGAWWNAVSPQYNVMAAQFGSLYSTPADQRVIARDAVQVARDAIAAVSAPPCAARAQQALISAAQTALNVTTQIAAGDTSTYTSGRGTLEIAFAEMYVAIWGDGSFATEANTPPALGVPRLGSDAACSPDTRAWYDSIRVTLQAFEPLLNTDPAPLLGPRLRTLINDMRVSVGTVQNSTPPACATTARDLLAAALEGYARGNELIGNGDLAGAQASFAAAARAEFTFNAWMNWLGVPPI